MEAGVEEKEEGVSEGAAATEVVVKGEGGGGGSSSGDSAAGDGGDTPERDMARGQPGTRSECLR